MPYIIYYMIEHKCAQTVSTALTCLGPTQMHVVGNSLICYQKPFGS